MEILDIWEIPSPKTITIQLQDADGNSVNFADHTVLQIEALINKVSVKKFALEGDDYSANVISAAADPTQCTFEFSQEPEELEEEETPTQVNMDDWDNGVMEFNIYKERGSVRERELIQAFIIKKPQYT